MSAPNIIRIELAPEQIEAVAVRVVELLDDRREALPALLDRQLMAKKLGICVDSLDKLRRKPGFPELRLLDSPRFELAAVLEWIRGGGA